jgi:hypothetical protein
VYTFVSSVFTSTGLSGLPFKKRTVLTNLVMTTLPIESLDCCAAAEVKKHKTNKNAGKILGYINLRVSDVI